MALVLCYALNIWRIQYRSAIELAELVPNLQIENRKGKLQLAKQHSQAELGNERKIPSRIRLIQYYCLGRGLLKSRGHSSLGFATCLVRLDEYPESGACCTFLKHNPYLYLLIGCQMSNKNYFLPTR
jgi:hypothetical protein